MFQILELMQINHCSDMLINALLGNEENSREQAIRLAIATELAGNPSILFLDLPTKGLDSHNSGHVVECLKVKIIYPNFIKTCSFISRQIELIIYLRNYHKSF
jgi:energy-coupling factor transporter ATP-binding protein EcfA2